MYARAARIVARRASPEWTQRNRLLRAARTLTADELANLQDAKRSADPVR